MTETEDGIIGRLVAGIASTALPVVAFRAAALDDTVCARLMAVHCTAEQSARLCRFVHAIDRFRGLGSIMLQRWLIECGWPDLLPLSPTVFHKTSYGKPYVRHPQISHRFQVQAVPLPVLF
jgi:hypothetical protein